MRTELYKLTLIVEGGFDRDVSYSLYYDLSFYLSISTAQDHNIIKIKNQITCSPQRAEAQEAKVQGKVFQPSPKIKQKGKARYFSLRNAAIAKKGKAGYSQFS